MIFRVLTLRVRVQVGVVTIASVCFGAQSIWAAPPMTMRLADESGVGHVSASVGTDRLRGKVWVRRVGGTGIAVVAYSALCSKREHNTVTSAVQWANLKLRPGQRALAWTYTDGTPCTLSFVATGSGRVRLVVQGF